MRRLCLAVTLSSLLPAASDAGIFDGLFFFPPASAVDVAVGPDQSQTSAAAGLDQAVCIRAIRQAERAHGIPHNLLMALGLQEAGMTFQGARTIWPWSVNVEGRGHRFDTRLEAEAFVQGQLERGIRSIDVGCLQINLRWHPDAFPTPRDGFDPALNADYAARFLRDLRAQTGDWRQAAGRYHSATPEHKALYLKGVDRQLATLESGAVAIDALAEKVPPAQADVVAPMPVTRAPGIRVAAAVPQRMRPLKTSIRRLPPRGSTFLRVLEPLPASVTNQHASPSPVVEQTGAGWSAALSDADEGAASLYGGAAQPLFLPSPPAH